MKEPTQQEITTANIEMIVNPAVMSLFYAANVFQWNGQTGTKAIIDGYEGLVSTNYWQYASWVKYYGGLAIAGTTFLTLALGPLVLDHTAVDSVLMYGQWATMIQVIAYLVLALLTAKQMRDEQLDAASGPALAMMNWLYGDVAGFLGVIATCEFMMTRNMPAWTYGRSDYKSEAEALFTDF